MSVNTTNTPRGEQAKLALLEAAIEIFGLNGPNSATTRQIAQRADQNIAAIAYYFGSKDGLYLAVAQHIADIIRDEFRPVIEEIDLFLENRTDEQDENRCLQLIELSFLAYNELVLKKSNINISRIMSREQLIPTKAYTLIHEQALSAIFTRQARLVARYTGLPDGHINTLIHTHALMGEILSFRLARENLLRQTGWDNIGPKEYDMINEVLREHIRLLLSGLQQHYRN